MENLAEKIEEYSEELFSSLGQGSLPEERKADIYARVQEHFHEIILGALKPVLDERKKARLHDALDQENYNIVSEILRQHPSATATLEEKIEEGFQELKLTIELEQKNAEV